MLMRNEAERKKRNKRRNKDSEELNEMDNVLSNLISEMKNAALDDRHSNEMSMCALKKLKLLPDVVLALQKSDYHAAMIELGMLGAIAEWLAPLPDRSLPNIKLREELINGLQDFGEINTDYLKSSGIGKAVMFLFKHPKEVKSNKRKLEKLINNWSRPIFSLDGTFKQLTREERLARDMQHVKAQERRKSNENNPDYDEIINDGSKKSKNNGNEEPKK
jgi:transcription factor SPN1